MKVNSSNNYVSHFMKNPKLELKAEKKETRDINYNSLDEKTRKFVSGYENALSDMDALDTMMRDEKEKKISDRILKKIARGEKLSPEEQSKAMGIDPQLLAKAKFSNEMREQAKIRIRQAKSKTEAMEVVMSVKTQAINAIEVGDTTQGELIMEAASDLEKEIGDVKEDKKDKSYYLENKISYNGELFSVKS